MAYYLIADNKRKMPSSAYLQAEMTEAHGGQAMYPSGELPASVFCLLHLFLASNLWWLSERLKADQKPCQAQRTCCGRLIAHLCCLPLGRCLQRVACSHSGAAGRQPVTRSIKARHGTKGPRKSPMCQAPGAVSGMKRACWARPENGAAGVFCLGIGRASSACSPVPWR